MVWYLYTIILLLTYMLSFSLAETFADGLRAKSSASALKVLILALALVALTASLAIFMIQ